MTRPGGRAWSYERDDLKRVKSIVDIATAGGTPEAIKTSFSYVSGTDLVSQRTRTVVDEDFTGATSSTDFVTAYSWDSLGRLRRIEDFGAAGQPPETHGFWYYATGDTQWHVRWKGTVQPGFGTAASREQNFMPDALGRLVEHRLLDDPNGTSPADIVLGLAHYDWTDATTNRSRMERTDGLGQKTVTHYDFAGRADVIQRPGAPSYAANAGPQIHSMVGEYDAASRLVKMTHGTPVPTGSGTVFPEVSIHRDGLGRVLARELPNILDLPFHSVMATREVLERDFLGHATKATTYSGDLLTPQAVVEVFTAHDALGRVHSEGYKFGWLDHVADDQWTVGIDYDANFRDRRSKLTYHGGLEIEHRWDSIGRLAGLDWNPDGSSELLANYGHFGHRTSWRRLKPEDAATGVFLDTDYEFDAFGRTSAIRDARIGSSPQQFASYDFVYDDWGNLVEEQYDRLDGNSSTTNQGDLFAYDRFHRLKQAILGDPAGAPGSSSGFVAKLTYNLDAAGNRETVDREDGAGATTTTDYDAVANRYVHVDQVPVPNPRPTYLYDDRGNLIQDKQFFYVYDFKDRLSEVYALVESEPVAESTALDDPEAFESQYVSAELASARPLEEARLRILQRVRGDVWQIARSAQRRQAAGELTEPVELPSGTTLTNSSGQQTTQSSSSQTSLQLIALYGYDPFDRRIARVLVAASSTYLHVYDGWREIEELLVEPSTGTKTAVKQFVWGERLDEMVAYRRLEVVQGSLEWVSYHVTQLGHESITRVIDEEGNLLEQSVYDPYGKPTVFDASEAPIGAVSGVGLPFSWKGHRVDPETGLIYMRHRFYSRELGRFVSVDPIGSWGDRLNLGGGYSYGGSAPQVYLDPYGRQGETAQAILDFWRGAADDVTFGYATEFRVWLWGDEGKVICETAHTAGQYAAIIIPGNQFKKIGRGLAKEVAEEFGEEAVDRLLKKGARELGEEGAEEGAERVAREVGEELGEGVAEGAARGG